MQLGIPLRVQLGWVRALSPDPHPASQVELGTPMRVQSSHSSLDPEAALHAKGFDSVAAAASA